MNVKFRAMVVMAIDTGVINAGFQSEGEGFGFEVGTRLGEGNLGFIVKLRTPELDVVAIQALDSDVISLQVGTPEDFITIADSFIQAW